MKIENQLADEVLKYVNEYNHPPRSIMISVRIYNKLSEWSLYRKNQKITIQGLHIEMNPEQEVDVVLTKPSGDYSTLDVEINLP